MPATTQPGLNAAQTLSLTANTPKAIPGTGGNDSQFMVINNNSLPVYVSASSSASIENSIYIAPNSSQSFTFDGYGYVWAPADGYCQYIVTSQNPAINLTLLSDATSSAALANANALSAALLVNPHVTVIGAGTFYVQGGCTIPSGRRLTLAPGVILHNYGNASSGAPILQASGASDIIIEGGAFANNYQWDDSATTGVSSDKNLSTALITNGGAVTGSGMGNALQFYNCANVTIRNTKIYDSVKYGILFSACTNAVVDSIFFSTANDGVHCMQSCSNVRITNLSGFTNDNTVAFTPFDWPVFNWPVFTSGMRGQMSKIYVSDINTRSLQDLVRFTNGDTISDVVVERVAGKTYSANAAAGVHGYADSLIATSGYPSPGLAMDRVVVRDITTECATSPQVWFSTMYNDGAIKSSQFGSVTVCNVETPVSRNAFYGQVHLNGAFKTAVIDNVTNAQGTTSGTNSEMVVLDWADSSLASTAPMQSVSISNLNYLAGGGSKGIRVNNLIYSLTIDKVKYRPSVTYNESCIQFSDTCPAVWQCNISNVTSGQTIGASDQHYLISIGGAVRAVNLSNIFARSTQNFMQIRSTASGNPTIMLDNLHLNDVQKAFQVSASCTVQVSNSQFASMAASGALLYVSATCSINFLLNESVASTWTPILVNAGTLTLTRWKSPTVSFDANTYAITTPVVGDLVNVTNASGGSTGTTALTSTGLWRYGTGSAWVKIAA